MLTDKERGKVRMNKTASLLKPLMPILSAAYGLAVIYVTALPLADDKPSFTGEMLSWLLTLAAIALTLFLVCRVEPKVFPAAGQFPLKLPKLSVFAGLLLIAPLWLVQADGYLSLPSPWRADSRLRGDGNLVWNAPRA